MPFSLSYSRDKLSFALLLVLLVFPCSASRVGRWPSAESHTISIDRQDNAVINSSALALSGDPLPQVLGKASQTRYGKIITLRGFTDPFWNTEYAEDFDRKIGGHTTYWSTGAFIYFCSHDSEWQVVGTSSYELVQKDTSDCRANLILGRVLGHSLHTSTVNARELIDGKFKRNQEAGVGDISEACGSHNLQPSKCNLPSCTWSDARKQCAANWNVIVQIGIDDIKQGELGSCYFLAALGSIALNHADLLEQMFVHKETWHGKNPVYTTKWLLDGEALQVSVDDAIPVSPRGGFVERPAFVGITDSHEVWPAVLEKAWAKIFGNFKNVEAGYPGEALKALTQAPLDIIRHIGKVGEKIDFDALGALWNTLDETTRQGFPMLSAAVEETTNNIAQGHCYVVVGTKMASVRGQSRRAVHLYNPWGKNQYQGELPSDPDSGHFTMLLEEYANSFTYTAVAAVRKGYTISTVSVPLEVRNGVAHFKFKMKRREPFAIMVEWPNFRLFDTIEASNGVNTTMCKPLDPKVEIAVEQPPGALKVVDQATFCSGTVQTSPHFCDSAYYQQNCAYSCNKMTKATHTRDQRWLEMSNIRANMPGGVGEYAVQLKAGFRTGTGKMINKLQLMIYAAEPVTIRSGRSTLVGSSLLEKDVDLMMPDVCLRLYNRLHKLDNWEQIMRDGEDEMFPHQMSSIASPGASCGDAAHGIEEDCSKYNRWANFHEIMMGHAGGGNMIHF